MNNTYAIIYNPTSHRFNQKILDQIKVYMDLHSKTFELFPTEYEGHAQEIVLDLIPKSPKTIVAMGGDGTINEVSQNLVGQNIPLGIIPSGTANVLALEFGIPSDPVHAMEIILSQNIQSINIGEITYQHNEESKSRYFLLMAGIGTDAHICKNINTSVKKFLGKGAYGIETLKSFAKKSSCFDLHLNKKTFLSQQTIVSNSRFYGGQYIVTPDASPFNKDFQICTLNSDSSFDLLNLLLRIGIQKHQKMKQLELVSSSEVKIHTENISIQVDGDYIGTSPCNISRKLSALNVVLPT
ncbi:MAG: diacylglycerol kinase family lipid kinase [Candidatus Cloacimonetes bacterium]|nr:diacylglycerol kinase family lipid kinase [Candidatus Cloacimonadota bacterium]